MKKARVNSVTCFAKCHHGCCYYPTQTGVSHEAIGNRDLLGEQIEALHREGIRAPIYTTVVWEEDAAQRHPEWRQMTKDGHFATSGLGPDGSEGHLGMWKFNNFLDPEYQDYFEAHLLEVLERYGGEVDGFFIDILFFSPNAGFSEASLDFKAKHGLKGRNSCPQRSESFRQATPAMMGARVRRGSFRCAKRLIMTVLCLIGLTPSVGIRWSFCRTPPDEAADRYPAVVAGEGFVYFADPIFREYRQTGNMAARDVWKKVMARFVGPPTFGDGLPTTVQVYPMRKGRDLLLTLLHYIPIRKAMDIDVIEERSSYAGEVLKIGGNAGEVLCFESGESLESVGDGALALPARKGRLLLRVPRYF